MRQVSLIFFLHKPVYKLKNGLKQFLEFSVLYCSTVRLFVLYIVYLYRMPRKIPIKHRERIVRAFEDGAEDSLSVTDTLGVNRSMARGIVVR